MHLVFEPVSTESSLCFSLSFCHVVAVAFRCFYSLQSLYIKCVHGSRLSFRHYQKEKIRSQLATYRFASSPVISHSSPLSDYFDGRKESALGADDCFGSCFPCREQTIARQTGSKFCLRLGVKPKWVFNVYRVLCLFFHTIGLCNHRNAEKKHF